MSEIRKVYSIFFFRILVEFFVEYLKNSLKVFSTTAFI